MTSAKPLCESHATISELHCLDRSLFERSTPAVTLWCENPSALEDSMVRGAVHVNVMDSVFCASNGWRHAVSCAIIAASSSCVAFRETDSSETYCCRCRCRRSTFSSARPKKMPTCRRLSTLRRSARSPSRHFRGTRNDCQSLRTSCAKCPCLQAVGRSEGHVPRTHAVRADSQHGWRRRPQ